MKLDELREGMILYFTPFIFPDGGNPKPKYFLVLKLLDGGVVLASLPTSKDYVPSSLSKEHGCINEEKINFNCYLFKAGRVVCDNGFAFPRETYVYGYRLREFDIPILKKQLESQQTVIECLGILNGREYDNIRKCLHDSSSVKRRYRKML